MINFKEFREMRQDDAYTNMQEEMSMGKLNGFIVWDLTDTSWGKDYKLGKTMEVELIRGN